MNPYSPPAATYPNAYAQAAEWRPPFVALGWRTILASLSIVGVVTMSFVLDVVTLSVGDSVAGDDPDLASSLLLGGAGLGLILAQIAAAVFFGIWVHRAASNLRSLGRTGLEYTPGWCVGWFFVPFANLVKPYKAVSEIWRNSDASGWASSSSVLPLWWATWIISGFLGNISSRIDDPGASATIGLIGSAISAIAAVTCIVVMRGVQNRQSEAAAQQRIA